MIVERIAQAGIKIAGRNINIKYADDTTLMEESKEELNQLPRAGLQGGGLWEKGLWRRKEDVGCGSCSTRNFIKAEIQAQGARHHFGIKRVIYQLTYIPR